MVATLPLASKARTVKVNALPAVADDGAETEKCVAWAQAEAGDSAHAQAVITIPTASRPMLKFGMIRATTADACSAIARRPGQRRS